MARGAAFFSVPCLVIGDVHNALSTIGGSANGAGKRDLLPFLDGTVVPRGDYKRQAFSLHSHPIYVIASITSGGLRFRCEGDVFVAPSGQSASSTPMRQTGEAAISAGWSYWSAYVPASMFGAIGEVLLPRQ